MSQIGSEPMKSVNSKNFSYNFKKFVCKFQNLEFLNNFIIIF